MILITRAMKLRCGTPRVVQCGPRVCAGRIGMCRSSHSNRGEVHCQEGISPTSLSTVLFHCFGRWQGEPSVSSLTPPLLGIPMQLSPGRLFCSFFPMPLLLLKNYSKLNWSVRQSVVLPSLQLYSRLWKNLVLEKDLRKHPTIPTSAVTRTHKFVAYNKSNRRHS